LPSSQPPTPSLYWVWRGGFKQSLPRDMACAVFIKLEHLTSRFCKVELGPTQVLRLTTKAQTRKELETNLLSYLVKNESIPDNFSGLCTDGPAFIAALPLSCYY